MSRCSLRRCRTSRRISCRRISGGYDPLILVDAPAPGTFALTMRAPHNTFLRIGLNLTGAFSGNQ